MIYKYRVWDKVNKKMLYPDGMTGDNVNKNTEIIMFRLAQEMNGCKDEFQEQYELMPCIGLKDSIHKKNIYVGDIYTYNQPLFKMGKQIYKKHIIIVEDNISSWYQIYCLSSVGNCNVIGNIYETPELIGEEYGNEM